MPLTASTYGKARIRVMRSDLRGRPVTRAPRSGWSNVHADGYRAPSDADDRIAAAGLDANGTWNAVPAERAVANPAVPDTPSRVFGTTDSASVRDSLYRRGEAVLAAIPEIAEVGFAMPDTHDVPNDLRPAGPDDPGTVSLPADEPHGPIQATTGRSI